MKYRSAKKLLENYGQTFLDAINPETGRIHPEVWQIGTGTGRVAAKSGVRGKTNTLNIPRLKAFRHAFGTDIDRMISTVDFGGAELRIMADKSGDPLMVKVYLPTMAEIQPPVRHLQFSGSWTESHLLYLNLSTGTLNAEGPGDLKFEIMGGMTSIASKFSKNFKVTALGGAKVAVPDADGALANLPPGTTLAELQKTDPTTADLVICPPLDLESFLKMAPQHHYTDTLSMAYIGDFYYKSPDGHRYARVSLKALGNGIYSPAGGPSGDIYLGTTDSRILLYNPKAK